LSDPVKNSANDSLEGVRKIKRTCLRKRLHDVRRTAFTWLAEGPQARNFERRPEFAQELMLHLTGKNAVFTQRVTGLSEITE
jgi:hypothetical protein